MLKQILYKLIYKERSSAKQYCKFLSSRCRHFGSHIYFANPHKTYLDKDALEFIEVGDYVQILSGVTILAHDESYSVCGMKFQDYPRKQAITKIGNNVFIGMNSIILMGAEIGDNVIVGAGSVVSGHVESNSVYAGNPAIKIATIEQYYQKHKETFERSAYLYFDAFYQRNHRFPSPDEMHVYKILFGHPLSQDVNKWGDVISKVNENKIIFGKYQSVDEFMEKLKSGH